MKVKLTQAQKIQVNDSKDVYGIMRKILLREDKYGRSKEHFWVVGLDVDNRILYIELISLGSITFATVNPNDVFRLAVRKEAAGVILVHNHPGENLEPSDKDLEVTDRLIQSAKILSTEVLDHIIISTETYFSFVQTGYFAVLIESEKFVTAYAKMDRLKEESYEKGIGDGKKERDIEIAKELLKNGAEIDMIVKSTGLSKTQITGLSKTKKKIKK